MVDPKVSELSRKLTEVALVERREQLQRAIERALNDPTSTGLARSGAAILAVQDLCVAEISTAVDLAWRHLKRALSDLGGQPSEHLAQDLKVELFSQLIGYSQYLEQVLRGHHVRLLGSSSSPGADPLPSETAGRLRRAFELANTRIGAEIELDMLSAMRQVPGAGGQPPTILHFHQPVGAVQTGAGAIANVVQNLGHQDRQRLISAIEGMKEAIATSTEPVARPKAELVDLLEEGRAELEKPTPNALRIGAVLFGVATAIQTVASLQPAYQALKAALAPLGVQLP